MAAAAVTNPMSSQSPNIPANTDPSALLNRQIPGNPTPLSASQEQQVRDLYYKRVRTLCADEIREFATCASNKTISATWSCRGQRNIMNSCMVTHATQENQDAARVEWFATKDQRRKEREEKEARRKDAEALKAGWWSKEEEEQRRARQRAKEVVEAGLDVKRKR